MGGKGRNGSGLFYPEADELREELVETYASRRVAQVSGCDKGQVHQLIDYCVSCFYLIRVVGSTAVQPAAFGRLDQGLWPKHIFDAAWSH